MAPRRDPEALRLRAIALRARGDAHVARGEYARAAAACRRALALAESDLAPEDAAGAMNDLAVAYKYLERFVEAGRLYRRALRILVRVHGAPSLDVASVLHNLGGLYHARGDYDRAEPYARRAVALRKRKLGPRHSDVAADIAALAAILHGQARRTRDRRRAARKESEAEALYREAIAIFERTLGKRHFEVGFNLGQLAALYQTSGRLAQAARAYARAIPIQRAVLGPRHPQLAITRANFAKLRLLRSQ